MIENNQKQNNDKVWWKPAVQLFSQVSTWIVVPMVLSLIVGKSLDTHYGTKPIIFLILAGIGFLISLVGIVRIIKKYSEELKKIEEENKKDFKQ